MHFFIMKNVSVKLLMLNVQKWSDTLQKPEHFRTLYIKGFRPAMLTVWLLDSISNHTSFYELLSFSLQPEVEKADTSYIRWHIHFNRHSIFNVAKESQRLNKIQNGRKDLTKLFADKAISSNLFVFIYILK